LSTIFVAKINSFSLLPSTMLLFRQLITIGVLLTLVTQLVAQNQLDFDVQTTSYSQTDLAVLEEIIKLNQLDVEPLALGTQVWHQGRLTWFAIDGNNLKISFLPSVFGDLDQLTHLYLPANHLRELPCSIGNLRKLEALYLNNNAIEKLPHSMGSLCQLKNLYLNGNKLREIPSCLGKLSQLRNLYLNDNLLNNIPDAVAKLPAIRNLYF